MNLIVHKNKSCPPLYSDDALRGICDVDVAYPPSQWKSMHEFVGPLVIRRAILGVAYEDAFRDADTYGLVSFTSPKASLNLAQTCSGLY